MSDNHIPIIGQTRSWKSIQFVCNPVANEPTILAPGVQPDITAWLFGFVAMRSDDLPIKCLNVVPVEAFTSTQRTMELMGLALRNLETFRTCDCLPNHPCLLHAEVAQRAS